jgi:hypothetical protein
MTREVYLRSRGKHKDWMGCLGKTKAREIRGKSENVPDRTSSVRKQGKR